MCACVYVCLRVLLTGVNASGNTSTRRTSDTMFVSASTVPKSHFKCVICGYVSCIQMPAGIHIATNTHTHNLTHALTQKAQTHTLTHKIDIYTVCTKNTHTCTHTGFLPLTYKPQTQRNRRTAAVRHALTHTHHTTTHTLNTPNRIHTCTHTHTKLTHL